MSIFGLKSVALLSTAAIGMTTVGLGLAAGHTRLFSLGHGGHHFGQASARLHVEFVVDRVLKVAEATPAQREKVDAIVERAFAEHGRVREQHEALHAEALEIFSAPTVDRERLEGLRAKHMQAAEEGSRHITAVLADIADVLTPDQRQKVAAHVRQMFE